MTRMKRLPVLSLTITLLGVAPLAAQVVLHEVSGDAVGDGFANSVAAAGDVNGDGIPDFVVGAPQDDDNGSASGSARAFSGADGAILFTWHGDGSSDQFGTGVGGAGDVDGDGRADLIVGAPRDDNNGSSSGMARVFSGMTGGVLYQVDGPLADDRLGWSVAGAGDVDGDGFSDFLIGSIRADTVNGANSGAAYVRSGQTGGLLHTFLGDAADSEMGRAVAGGLDIDLDGRPDLVVGIYRDDAVALNAGRVRVFSGASGAPFWTKDGPAAGDLYGWSVGMVDDADGDGRADVVVGAPFHSGPGLIVNGLAHLLTGAGGGVIRTIDGLANGDQLGSSVSGAGDIDGDGRGDYVIGADHAAVNGSSSGSVTAFSGQDGSVLVHDDGPVGSAALGITVAAVGDVNGDGRGDFLAGAGDLVTNGGSGTARVYSGCLGALTTYGAGCPGSLGLPLSLALVGCPEPGGTITLSVGDGIGGGTAVVFFGLAEGALPMGAGCLLLVTPLLGPMLPLPLSPAGTVSISGALPGVAGGYAATMQAFQADPGTATGFFNSNGARLSVP